MQGKRKGEEKGKSRRLGTLLGKEKYEGEVKIRGKGIEIIAVISANVPLLFLTPHNFPFPITFPIFCPSTFPPSLSPPFPLQLSSYYWWKQRGQGYAFRGPRSLEPHAFAGHLTICDSTYFGPTPGPHHFQGSIQSSAPCFQGPHVFLETTITGVVFVRVRVRVRVCVCVCLCVCV